jgi:hypothetical protein
MPRPAQDADLAAGLDCLLPAKAAEVPGLQLASVLAGGQRADHGRQIAFAQPLQLGDDLAM